MRLRLVFQCLLSALLVHALSVGASIASGSPPHQLNNQDIKDLTLQNMPPGPDIFAPSPWIDAKEVVLQGLDKITARVFTVTAHVNQLVKFGTLDIYIRKGYKASPEDPPESVCFLEIFERKADENPKCVFSGWMFASNPSLFPLEHPVYDVWVKEVKTAPQIGTPPQAAEGCQEAQTLQKDEDVEDGF